MPFNTLATQVVSGLQQFEDTCDVDEGVNWNNKKNENFQVFEIFQPDGRVKRRGAPDFEVFASSG